MCSSLVTPASVDEQQLLSGGAGGFSPRVRGSHLGSMCLNRVGQVRTGKSEDILLGWRKNTILSESVDSFR